MVSALSDPHTSIIRHNARIAFARYTTSLPTDVSFMILLVTMMMSSADFASSLMTRYTICRRLASLFWKSFDMPKKRVVASFVGKVSPVKRRRAILVRRMRHFRGDMGEVLKTRATICQLSGLLRDVCKIHLRTFLEDRRSVHLHKSPIHILILLITHYRQLPGSLHVVYPSLQELREKSGLCGNSRVDREIATSLESSRQAPTSYSPILKYAKRTMCSQEAKIAVDL